MTTIRIECRDPVVSRDGRPFGAGQGNKMRSLVWPTPSAVAGSLRTAVGKTAQKDFSKQDSDDLFRLEVAGVFPVVEGKTLYLPAPNDCLVEKVENSDAKKVHRVQPVNPYGLGGCDLPDAGLWPIMLTEDQAKTDFKPDKVPSWWPLDSYIQWLTDSDKVTSFNEKFLDSPVPEERTHVVMSADTGAGIDGQLFSTAALPLTHLPKFGAKQEDKFAERYAEISLTARAKADGWCGEQIEKLDVLHPLGGERRLVHWKKDATDDLWKCPDNIRTALKSATHLRMVLATPAIFEHGWKPGWLNDKLEGTPPDSTVKLKLVGFTIGRWKAISGWSMAAPRGPKPIRRMVPAGGVYFFEYIDGDRNQLAGRWLHSVCDNEQDRRDGFGLACWGTWTPN